MLAKTSCLFDALLVFSSFSCPTNLNASKENALGLCMIVMNNSCCFSHQLKGSDFELQIFVSFSFWESANKRIFLSR